MRRGFSLVELLVAMAVGTLVAGAALVALSSTFRSWARLSGGGTALDTDRAMLRLERDVASALPLPDVPMEAERKSLRLAMERGGRLRVVAWEADGKRLVRHERDYLHGAEEGFDGHGAGGRPVPEETLAYRLPAEAAFSWDAAADALRVESATNLPPALTVTIPPFSRNCPFRLRSP